MTGRVQSPDEIINAWLFDDDSGDTAADLIDALHAAGFLLMSQAAFDPYQSITDATGFSTTTKVKP